MTAKRKTPYDRRKMGTRAKLRRVNIERNATRAIRPRLSIHRTNKQIYAQVIDDVKGVTLVAASSADKDAKADKGHSVDAATAVGKLIAERATKAGVKKVQFDRGAFVYHGRVKALADGAREGGLEF
ncbi:MAG: 50S ribosomal protein L18 [Pseudomonadota bacterium]